MTVHFDKLDNDLNSASSPFGVVAVATRPGLYRNVVKRVLDITVVLILAPIVLPVIGLLALGVARDGHTPFYWSTRVGKAGRNFPMLKLRTMLPDADRLLDSYLLENSDAKEEWTTTQKLKNDPRITRFGKALRKTSLDELPQLWNVFKGDMSLVGPRPMLPVQRALYPGLCYYLLNPGITGPWQVSDRNESEFAKRAEHDRQYDEEMSFFTDIKYLVRTIGVVLKGTGY
ncbi:MAG: sugar transferase [Paracoccaceae bacterium]